MELLPTFEGEPPTPRPIRVWDRWRVSWHGRRDAKLRPVGADLPRPYLESLRAEAEAGQRAVSRWLHKKIIPLDREVVRLLTILDQFQRDPVSRPNPALLQAMVDNARATDDQPNQHPATKIPVWLIEVRQATAALQAYERRQKEQNIAEQQLGQLGSVRHHLIEAARAGAGAYLARYEQLVALYNAALLRSYPHRTATEAHRKHPEITTESWVYGDMPLLALEVEGELSASYRWFLKEFANRTSAFQPPVPMEITRAG